MERFETDVAVIGAGVVGLAIARAFARAGRDVVILEKNKQFGMETSARNSEVIHAGIYYTPGSLKARLCVEGRHRLYDFAARHGVPHRRIGKWLVATSSAQEPALEAIAANARANGVEDLSPVAVDAARQEEPGLRFTRVLQSPSTGIIDSHQYMLALLGDAQGAELVRDAEVTRVERRTEGWRLLVRNAGDELLLDASVVVNSAGLWAQGIAHATEGLLSRFVPPRYLAKGSYTAISGGAPFHRLIYPMPEVGGLGVHLTLDLGGQARLGPDVEWLDSDDPAQIDYAVRTDIAADFVARVKSWWPGATAERLSPAYSGVRPKIAPRSEVGLDFRIDGPQIHGLPGLVNLFGIESPGLTSSLAIADYVGALLA